MTLQNHIVRKPVRLSPSDRFLVALCQPGASAGLVPDGSTGRIVLSIPRKGISLAAVSATVDVAQGLLAEGLACLQTADPRRMVASEPGRARAARVQAGEDVPPFLAQHLPVVRSQVIPGDAPVALDAGESPLGWLARRKDAAGKPLIDAICLAAGERLRRDITMAQMLPRVTSNWSGNVGSKSSAGVAVHFSESAAAARQRVERAMEAVGADMAGLVLDVCGFLKGLEMVESERGWPRRSARIVLVLALGRLARHYGLAREASGPGRSGGVRQWGTADYRPEISPA